MFRRTLTYFILLTVSIAWMALSHGMIVSDSCLQDNNPDQEWTISNNNNDNSHEVIRVANSLFLTGSSPRVINECQNNTPDLSQFNGSQSIGTAVNTTGTFRTISLNSLSGYSSKRFFAQGRITDYYVITLRQLII